MTQAICDITTDEVNVDVVVEPQADTMVEVANRAGGMEQVFHDNTLIGNGNSIDLGVNTDLIATKEYVDEKVESIDTYTKDQIDGKLTAVDAQIDANADAIQKTREDYIQADSEIHQILNNHAENLTTLHNDVDDLGDQVAEIETKIPESASETNQLVTQTDLTNKKIEIMGEVNESVSELQTQITAQASAIEGKVDKAGDTMTGTLNVPELNVATDEGTINLSITAGTATIATNNGLDIVAQTKFDTAPTTDDTTAWADVNATALVTKQQVTTALAGAGGGSAEYPDQTDNAGKFLMTDGEDVSWQPAIRNNSETPNALAIGVDASANRNGAVALGLDARATAYQCTALGMNTLANLDYSVALGFGAWATHDSFDNNAIVDGRGEGAIAIGVTAKSSSNDSIAIGDYATANGVRSIALGSDSSSTGSGAIAIGRNAVAKGQEAVVIGDNASSNASEGANVVIGPDSKVVGAAHNSVAIGIGSEARNYDATAIGRGSYAQAQYSTAIGHAANTDNTYADYNTADYQSTLALGMSAQSRSNSAIAIGKYVYADGPYSTVIGYKSKVEQGCSKGIAIGSEAQVIESEGIAVGNTANSARDGIALGTRAKVKQFGGVAIGLNTDSDGVNAVTIGNQSYARGDGSVALGNSAIVDYGADDAVQLGIGTNSDAYTLQFRDYTVIQQDGTIPYGRLSVDPPEDGFALVYDGQEDRLRWSKVGSGDETAGTEVIIRRWN